MPNALNGLEAESAWRQGGSHLRRVLEVLPAAAYTCDAGGLITYFNQRAVEVWGREPTVNDPIDRY
jgi:two-component system sensor kinase FixL